MLLLIKLISPTPVHHSSSIKATFLNSHFIPDEDKTFFPVESLNDFLDLVLLVNIFTWALSPKNTFCFNIFLCYSHETGFKGNESLLP